MEDLASKAGLNLRDSSINSTNPNNAKDPDYIKSNILAPQINWASTLLVYVTPKTKDSEWVNWEIEYAQKQGKRVVGVYAHGAGECDLPEALEKYADAMCGWNAEGLVDAITGQKNEWHGPEGELRDPRPIKRYGC